MKPICKAPERPATSTDLESLRQQIAQYIANVDDRNRWPIKIKTNKVKPIIKVDDRPFKVINAAQL